MVPLLPCPDIHVTDVKGTSLCAEAHLPLFSLLVALKNWKNDETEVATDLFLYIVTYI